MEELKEKAPAENRGSVDHRRKISLTALSLRLIKVPSYPHLGAGPSPSIPRRLFDLLNFECACDVPHIPPTAACADNPDSRAPASA